MVVVGLALAVVVPNVTGASYATLRAASGKVSGLVRTSYGQASLTGTTQRMTFDMSKNLILVEEAEPNLVFEPGSNAVATAAQGDDEERGALGDFTDELMNEAKRQREEQSEGDEDAEMMELGQELLGAFLGVNSLGGGSGMGMAGSFGGDAKKHPLPEGIVFEDIWIRGMSASQKEGQAYLYFLPHGYTQDAIIHLKLGPAGDEGQVIAVSIEALTGQARITNGYVDAPK
uniref:Prokaryotic N terminal methylation motif domain protein n=1 Tax=uncultured marine bacterium MedDCM-OCT-S01-C143 TaxID=743046 RepID=D6PCC2_9BACT|nr:prokaryotic N terminal methylation motif domain protein [uncultured marine bacterium MedDCM-OCT-S01-C143]